MSVSDRWLVAFLAGWGLLTATFFLTGLQGWGWLWLGILVLVGMGELWSKLATGKTLTQKLRARFATQRWLGYLLLGLMLLVWVLLLAHLGWPA